MHGCCCSRESRVIPSSIPGQQRKLRCDDPLMAATAASSSQRHSALLRSHIGANAKEAFSDSQRSSPTCKCRF
ncbi:unnamed protein product [Sphagnum tenellum]